MQLADLSPDLLHLLPAMARELIDAMDGDLAAYQRLIEWRGGVRVRIPKDAEGSELARHIGLPAAAALVAVYADDEIEPPRCHAAIREARRRAAIALRAQGRSVDSLALQFDVARSTMKDWLRQADQAAQRAATRDLFS